MFLIGELDMKTESTHFIMFIVLLSHKEKINQNMNKKDILHTNKSMGNSFFVGNRILVFEFANWSN